jgi:cobalt-precorrin 5A hydrolase
VRVAGFGFRSGAGVESLAAALEAAGGATGVGWLATVEAKAGGLAALAERLGLPVVGVTTARLTDAKVATRSEASLAAWGTGSVAEASALVAAGPGARLLTARRVSPDGRATCAIAEGPE